MATTEKERDLSLGKAHRRGMAILERIVSVLHAGNQKWTGEITMKLEIRGTLIWLKLLAYGLFIVGGSVAVVGFNLQHWTTVLVGVAIVALSYGVAIVYHKYRMRKQV